MNCLPKRLFSYFFNPDWSIEYYPSSTLCEDIRNLVKQYNTILTIYQKQLNDSKYKIIQYSNKKFNDQDIPISIRNLIEFAND